MNVKKIKKIISENTPIDKIMNYKVFPTYIEVFGCAGGDLYTYRIYYLNNSIKVVEK